MDFSWIFSLLADITGSFKIQTAYLKMKTIIFGRRKCFFLVFPLVIQKKKLKTVHGPLVHDVEFPNTLSLPLQGSQ